MPTGSRRQNSGENKVENVYQQKGVDTPTHTHTN